MPWSPMDLCEVLLGIFFYPAWIFRLDLGIMKIDWFITVPRWQNHIIFHLYMPSSNLRILLPITQINKSTRKNRVKFFPPIADTTVECTNRNYHHWPLAIWALQCDNGSNFGEIDLIGVVQKSLQKPTDHVDAHLYRSCSSVF